MLMLVMHLLHCAIYYMTNIQRPWTLFVNNLVLYMQMSESGFSE